MKKVSFIIVLLVLLCNLLSARSFTAKGMGSNESAAIAQANANLARQLYMDISTESFSYLLSSENEESGTFLSTSSQISSLSLPGVEVVDVSEVGANMVATVMLSDKNAETYAKMAENLAREIDELYKSLDSLENINSISTSELEEMLNLYSEWSSYSLIATLLDSTMDFIASPEVSRSEIISLQSARYQVENSQLRSQYNQLEILQQLGVDTGRAIFNADEIEAEFRAFSLRNEAMLEAQRMEAIKQIKEIQTSYGTSFDYAGFMDDVLESSNKRTFVDYLDSVKAFRMAFELIKTDMDEYLAGLDDGMNAAAEAFRSQNMDLPYYDWEMEDGEPSSTAVRQRTESIELEIDEAIISVAIEDAQKVFTDRVGQLGGVLESLENEMNDFSSKKWTYSSLQQELDVAITGYDLENAEFTGYASITLGGWTFRLDIAIPFEDWTGQPPYLDYVSNMSKYNEYRFLASEWLDILRESTSSILLDVTFHADAYIDSGRGNIYFDSYTVTRLDSGEKVTTKKNLNHNVLSVRPL